MINRFAHGVAAVPILIAVLGSTPAQAKNDNLEAGVATGSVESDESSDTVSDALNLNTGRLLFRWGIHLTGVTPDVVASPPV